MNVKPNTPSLFLMSFVFLSQIFLTAIPGNAQQYGATYQNNLSHHGPSVLNAANNDGYVIASTLIKPGTDDTTFFQVLRVNDNGVLVVEV